MTSSRLVHAEVEGEHLDDTEYTNFFQLFIFAGNETTRTGISQGILALIEHPVQFERLVTDRFVPVPTAVDEILRYGTPLIYFRRTATQDTEIRDVPIQAGDRVALWYLSANFDEDVFEEPQRFDVGRRPNPHVTFGRGGPHFCLGSFLARLEIRILLEEILARNVRFELAGPPVRLSSNFVNGFKSLPVRVVPDEAVKSAMATKIRAAVLHEFGTPLVVEQLDLAAQGGRGARPLRGQWGLSL